jgi:hypothetical protein
MFVLVCSVCLGFSYICLLLISGDFRLPPRVKLYAVYHMDRCAENNELELFVIYQRLMYSVLIFYLCCELLIDFSDTAL